MGPRAACYAVHAWNVARYITVRSRVPRGGPPRGSRVACGPLREPPKFKASPEFCVLTIHNGTCDAAS